MKENKKGLALLFVIFLMLLLSILGTMLASIFANRTALSTGFYHSNQTFFINDVGMERAKQKLYDDWTWRPADPPGYLEETLTIDALSAIYRIYVQDSVLDPDAVDITVESIIP